MFCLLCHEKISRLRAWRTKSEFCCDEHAEIYKRQTLERLLTDHDNTKPAEAPPLPVDTSPRGNAASVRAEEKTPASEVLARFDEEDARAVLKQRPEPSAEPEAFERAGRDEGLQELWRLAEEVSPASAEDDDDGWGSATARLSDASAGSKPRELGGLDAGLGSSLGSLGKGLGSGSGTVREQTPEEALAALRQLSTSPRRAASRLDEPSDELDTLLSARGFDATAEQRLEDLSAAGDDLSSSLDDALAGGESLPSFDAGSWEPLEDDELPAMLERLTEHASEAEELEHAAPRPVEAFAEELQPPAPLEAEISAELNLQPEASATQQEQAADTREEVSAAMTGPEHLEAGSDDLAVFGLLEEAVESHLEDSEELSSQRGFSHKVVPFPLSRPKTFSRDESEELLPAASQPAASASGERGRSGKLGKSPKAANGMPGDLSRLQLKPVAVMYGLEPTLFEPEGDAAAWPAASLGMRSGLDGIVEPPISYPDAGGGRRAGVSLHVHARLVPLLPELPEAPLLQGEGGHAAGPDYTVPCEPPLPLALRRNGEPGRPSVGSERAWMFRIEPALAEGSEFELQLPNGKRHAPWQAPWLPAALVSGVTRQNGSGKLDLSGPQGRFEPPVDRLCLVFPQLGELGAGIPRPSSSKAPGEELGRWMPPTVLDPRFEIERPAGRDLSDFG